MNEKKAHRRKERPNRKLRSPLPVRVTLCGSGFVFGHRSRMPWVKKHKQKDAETHEGDGGSVSESGENT